MTVQESPFLLLKLYAPTKVKEQIVFFQEILSAVQSANFDTEYRVIIGGDFNVHLDADLDNSEGQIEDIIFKISCSNIILSIFGDYEILIKGSLPGEKEILLLQCRIDFWLISDDLQDDVKKADITPAIETDHSAISLSVNIWTMLLEV